MIPGAFDGGMVEYTPHPKRPTPLSRAARLLGIRSDWLRMEAEAGRLPGFLAGDRWLFDLPTLERALHQRVSVAGIINGDCEEGSREP